MPYQSLITENTAEASWPSRMTLSDYLGDAFIDFPLLIKFIDAGDRLSVQVHPDSSVKDADGRSLGKTEMWYIIEAEPGAQLVYGLRNGVTKEDFSYSVENGNTENVLEYVDVSAGDVFFIPAGQVHAIGKGILLLEIQQNSDTTYRIYDYGRRDKNGKTRQLHISEALSVIKLRDGTDIESERFSKSRNADCIASCNEFTVYKYVISSPKKISFYSFGAVICVNGAGTILHDGISYEIFAGDTYFIPDGMGVFEISGELEIITAE